MSEVLRRTKGSAEECEKGCEPEVRSGNEKRPVSQRRRNDWESGNSTEKSSTGTLVRRIRPFPPVPAKRAKRTRTEAQNECNERAERKPVRVAVLRPQALVSVSLPRDAEEDHIDDPCDEGSEECETCDERHEDGARSMVRRAKEAEGERDA